MASMSYIVFPKKEQATKIVNDENWWTSDGEEVRFAALAAGAQWAELMADAIDMFSPGSGGINSRKYSWIELKVDLDTFTEGTLSLSVGTHYNGSSSGAAHPGVGISRQAFSAVGLESGVVAVSVQTNISGSTNNSDNPASWRGVYFNGHKVTSGLVRSSFGAHRTYDTIISIRAPEGVDIASVVVRLEDEPDVIRRWWYVKNLELTNQVGGQDEVTVNALEANTGYTHNESNHVEMGTKYQPREGSTITAAYLDCYARHVRNSVQFGTAETRPTIGDKECRLRSTRFQDVDQAPEYRQPLTLLDVGVDTYTNVGGGIQMPTDEDLKKVGLIVDLNHVNYEGI